MNSLNPESTKSSTTKCAIYTRVSTDSQADVAFNSCEAQEDRIRSFIDSQQGFVVAKVYSDPGYSGANLNRPALRQMLADIQAGLVDMVITYKIDRLTRSEASSRSNWAKVNMILRSNRPEGVDVSKRSVTEINDAPWASKSSMSS